jgi:MFS family permease
MLEIAVLHGTPGLLVGLALAGVGLGAFTPANNAAVMSASPAGHTGVVSGMLNMTRGLGTALGVALTGALFTAVAAATGANVSRVGAAGAGHGLTAALGVVGLLALATGSALLWRSSEPGRRVLTLPGVAQRRRTLWRLTRNARRSWSVRRSQSRARLLNPHRK